MSDDCEIAIPEVDFTRPNWARVWNYFLDGKDNYGVDRDVADEMITELPELSTMALAGRRFVSRAVRLLVERHGVRQFLDVGAGLPTATACPVHEIAQDVDPTSRVVYVDNDPMVAAHSVALLVNTSTPEGRVAFVCADARSPRRLLDNEDLAATLDLREPVALLLASVLMCVDDEAAADIVSTLLGALPAGSYLVLGHPAADFDADRVQHAAAVARGAGLPFRPRTRDRVSELFGGLELVDPGVVPVLDWHPTLDLVKGMRAGSRTVPHWVGVARKP